MELSYHRTQMMKINEKWDFRSFMRREPLLLVVVVAGACGRSCFASSLGAARCQWRVQVHDIAPNFRRLHVGQAMGEQVVARYEQITEIIQTVHTGRVLACFVVHVRAIVEHQTLQYPQRCVGTMCRVFQETKDHVVEIACLQQTASPAVLPGTLVLQYCHVEDYGRTHDKDSTIDIARVMYIEHILHHQGYQTQETVIDIKVLLSGIRVLGLAGKTIVGRDPLDQVRNRPAAAAAAAGDPAKILQGGRGALQHQQSLRNMPVINELDAFIVHGNRLPERVHGEILRCF
jgi:hypothetical protein